MGGGDGVRADLDLDGAAAAGGADEFPDGLSSCLARTRRGRQALQDGTLLGGAGGMDGSSYKSRNLRGVAIRS